MKTLLIFPPHWAPVSPHLSTVLLLGQLRKNGFDTDIRDLNVEFFNRVLEEDYIKRKAEELYGLKTALYDEITRFESTSQNNHEEIPLEILEKATRYKIIDNFLRQSSNNIEKLPELAQKAVNFIRSEESFYKPGVLNWSLMLWIEPILKTSPHLIQ